MGESELLPLQNGERSSGGHGVVDTSWLVGGGEMGRAVRAFDWSATPLGSIGGWPQHLRLMVRMVLECRYPMWMWWGPSLINIYNDAALPMLAARHPRALGRPGPEVWQDIWKDIRPLIEPALEGKACYVENQLLPLERNGMVEEAYFTFSYSPIRDDQGHVTGIICPVIEETQRVLSERRLKTLRALASARTEEAKSVEQACQTAVHILAQNPQDLPFVLTYLYDAQSRTARLGGVAGIPADSPAAPAQIDLTSAGAVWPLREVVELGRAQVVTDLEPRFGPMPSHAWPETTSGAIVLPVRSGQDRLAGFLISGVSPRRPLNENYRAFFDFVASHVATVLSNARAYEEERRRAESLAELHPANTAFFSNVSHEFRTPLTLMLGPTEAALSSGHGLQGEDLRAVYRNELRLLKLVNNLLDFARMEAGRAQASFEQVDIAALTTDLASTFRSAIERAGITFEIDCPPVEQPTYVDRGLWEKVVLNLVSNALKFTFHGTITVAIRQADTHFELTVSDTGTGVPAEEVPRLFERFHRIQGARSRTHEGSGIGLALVHEIVRMHGGTIGARSELGFGTTFTVRVPFGRAHLPADRVSGPAKGATPALGAEPFVQEAMRWLPDDIGGAREPIPSTQAPERAGRILVADDNADMRDYLRRLLGRRWAVEAVADGVAALEAARRQTPDLILSDVMMQGQDGFELVRRLREDPLLNTIPVILLSARAGQESRVEGLEAGADDYLVKPFAARELLARVATHLQLSQLRHATQRERKRLFGFLAQAPVPIAIFAGPDHVFELANAQYELFAGRSSLTGKSIREAFPEMPADAELWKTFDRVYATGEPYSADEYRQDLVRAGVPHEEYWRFSLHPLRNFDGAVEGLIAVVTNITESVRTRRAMSDARARAERANRTKDEFLAMLGHELRNPLAPILAILQHLRMRGGEALARKERELLERQVRQLASMVDDLMDVSRIAQGKVKLTRRPVELAEIVSKSVDVSSPLLEDREHKLRIDVPRGLVVNGDEGRLVQVLSNLLTNAAKYTDPGGRIEVTALAEASTAVIKVRDNGMGIPADMLAHVFERFTQGPQTVDRPQGGLGLGLSIVHNLVQLHGGLVGVTSAGPGQGSEFTVRLPLMSMKPSGKRKRTPAKPRIETARNPKAILLVEDNRDIAEVLADILRARGHTVEVAHDGPSALERVAKFRPRIALLDIGLPAMDGYELARRLRKQKGLARLKLAAVTGYGQASDRRRAERAGFSEHLVKPIDVERLLAVVESR
jgi:signal transduction histidine kinase